MDQSRHMRTTIPVATGVSRLSRRELLALVAAGGATAALARGGRAAFAPARSAAVTRAQTTPTGGVVDQLVIDLPSKPPSLDPAIVYDANSWSVVHSVYDSLVQYGSSGELEPLLAESARWLDPLTYEVKLRPSVTFHNGEPLNAEAVAFTVARLVDPKTASQVAGNFKVIADVKVQDTLTAHLTLSEPAPWLPAQMAAWLAILPPKYAGDPANDIGQRPVGTGPFRFVEWRSGDQITLEANEHYFAGSPKGRPIARRVIYRAVPEGATRTADLLSGKANIVGDVAIDQREPIVQAGYQAIAQPVVGSAWVRIATDSPPFSDVRVRQAVNHAVDVDTIIKTLLGGNGERLASFFPKGGLGFDPGLVPYAYDPDRARQLLATAGLAKGFETTFEYAGPQHADVVAALAAQLNEVGVRAKLVASEPATFNARWKDPQAPALRFATWRPLFDPFSLLSLVVSGEGFLSRYDNPAAQSLVEAGSRESDTAKRDQLYRQLAKVLHDDPAAIYLHSLTAVYGADQTAASWQPRTDEYVIATR